LSDPAAAGGLVSDGRRFVAAFQNRVVQIGHVNLARIKFHGHALVGKIHSHILDARYFHQHGTQFTDVFVAILAFGRGLNRLDDGIIGALRIKRIARFWFVRSRRIHQLVNVRRGLSGCDLSCDRLQHAPNILSENLLPGGVWMDSIGLVQTWIAADAFE